jgi:hypothetical protein
MEDAEEAMDDEALYRAGIEFAACDHPVNKEFVREAASRNEMEKQAEGTLNSSEVEMMEALPKQAQATFASLQAEMMEPQKLAEATVASFQVKMTEAEKLDIEKFENARALRAFTMLKTGGDPVHDVASPATLLNMGGDPTSSEEYEQEHLEDDKEDDEDDRRPAKRKCSTKAIGTKKQKKAKGKRCCSKCGSESHYSTTCKGQEVMETYAKMKLNVAPSAAAQQRAVFRAGTNNSVGEIDGPFVNNWCRDAFRRFWDAQRLDSTLCRDIRENTGITRNSLFPVLQVGLQQGNIVQPFHRLQRRQIPALRI